MPIKFKLHHFMLALISILLTSCASFSSQPIQDKTGAPLEATAESVAKNHSTKGLVLFDVNWGRKWKCSGYDNAQIMRFSFDRMPLDKRSNTAPADLTIQTPGRLMVDPVFVSYAMLVEPGEYALSETSIKVARPSSVDYWVVARKDLLTGAKPQGEGGSFKVAAGETVYIGNFALDCYRTPVIWRYYTEGSANFQTHLKQYKAKYPFIDTSNVTYRLFDTTRYGRAYELK